MPLEYFDEKPASGKLEYLDSGDATSVSQPEAGTPYISPLQALGIVGRSMKPHPLDAYTAAKNASTGAGAGIAEMGREALPFGLGNLIPDKLVEGMGSVADPALSRLAGTSAAISQIAQPLIGPAQAVDRSVRTVGALINSITRGHDLSKEEKRQLLAYTFKGEPNAQVSDYPVPAQAGGTSVGSQLIAGLSTDLANNPITTLATAAAAEAAPKIASSTFKAPGLAKDFARTLFPGDLATESGPPMELPSTGKTYTPVSPPEALTAMDKAIRSPVSQGTKAMEIKDRSVQSIIDAGYDPKNMPQTIEATQSTLGAMGKTIGNGARIATERGAPIDPQAIGDQAIEDYLKSKDYFRMHQDRDALVSNIRAITKNFDAAETPIQLAKDVSQRAAEIDQKIYSNYAKQKFDVHGDPQLGAEKAVLNALRNHLIDTVEQSVPELADVYGEMRRNYPALKQFQDNLVHREIVNGRLNPIGLYQALATLESIPMMIAHPGLGSALPITAAGLKFYNSPNFQIGRAFRLAREARGGKSTPQSEVLANPPQPQNPEPDVVPPSRPGIDRPYQAGDVIKDAQGNKFVLDERSAAMSNAKLTEKRGVKTYNFRP